MVKLSESRENEQQITLQCNKYSLVLQLWLRTPQTAKHCALEVRCLPAAPLCLSESHRICPFVSQQWLSVHPPHVPSLPGHLGTVMSIAFGLMAHIIAPPLPRPPLQVKYKLQPTSGFNRSNGVEALKCRGRRTHLTVCQSHSVKSHCCIWCQLEPLWSCTHCVPLCGEKAKMMIVSVVNQSQVATQMRCANEEIAHCEACKSTKNKKVQENAAACSSVELLLISLNL